jgi:hypothetical protein
MYFYSISYYLILSNSILLSRVHPLSSLLYQLFYFPPSYYIPHIPLIHSLQSSILSYLFLLSTLLFPSLVQPYHFPCNSQISPPPLISSILPFLPLVYHYTNLTIPMSLLPTTLSFIHQYYINFFLPSYFAPHFALHPLFSLSLSIINYYTCILKYPVHPLFSSFNSLSVAHPSLSIACC